MSMKHPYPLGKNVVAGDLCHATARTGSRARRRLDRCSIPQRRLGVAARFKPPTDGRRVLKAAPLMVGWTVAGSAM